MSQSYLSVLSQLGLLLALVVLFIVKSAWFKGCVGESLVRFNAKLYLDSSVYHALHNVTLETQILGSGLAKQHPPK